MRVEGSLGLSATGQIIRYSKALEEVTGYTEEEVLGREFSMLTPKPDWSAHKELLKEATEAQGVKGIKTSLLAKDGSTVEIYLSIFPLRTTTGTVHSFMLNLSMDKSEETPGILSDEFQRIFRFSNDAVAVTDRDGSIIDVNQAFLDLYGYTRDEVLGQNPRVLKSDHSTPELYENMWSDILDPEKGYWKGEIINRAKGGAEVPVLLSINAIKDEKGRVKNFLGIAFDMTRAKELEHVNRMYMDYIVHDLRGPLTSIMANAELLMMLDENANEGGLKKLKVIFSCADKINTMVSDILDYVRLQSGELELRKVRVPFVSVWKGAAVPFQEETKRLTLSGGAFEEGGEPVTINADTEKLKRIIYNLLRNAFKNAGSEVRVNCEIEGGELCCSVSDDGEDYTTEDAKSVFDSFYLTEEGVKSGSAGLGLSIVKSFVEAHDGRIFVEKGPGTGATITFRIPV